MTSGTKTSISTSVTALLSITTPFVQPTDCETQWRTASASSRTFRGTPIMTLLMVSDPAASCYPSGWDDVAPNDRLRFMPGVCPEAWTYNQMGENGSEAATTAFCCDSGFTYESLFDSSSKHRCRRWGWNTGTGGDFPDQATPSNEVTMVHQPWAVTWAASDTATLTPKLPAIKSSVTVPTWTPGETIPDSQWDANRSQDDGVQFELKGLMGFVVIGLPVMGLFVLCLYIWCCVRACRTKRREKRIVYVLDPAVSTTAYEMNARAQNG